MAGKFLSEDLFAKVEDAILERLEVYILFLFLNALYRISVSK